MVPFPPGGPADSVAWAAMLSSLVLSSDSKPFMTDSTVISAATPTQMPSIDTQLMKETKNPWVRLRT